VAEWSFVTNHSRALACIAHDPGVRLRDIAAIVGITERSAFAIVTDLSEAGYVVKEKDGRRNRYSIQSDAPLKEAPGGKRTIGELLDLLVDTGTHDRTSKATRAPARRVNR
jgi:DNA-binding transcriptional ArsR family regulator